jgi:hypothetical protein
MDGRGGTSASENQRRTYSRASAGVAAGLALSLVLTVGAAQESAAAPTNAPQLPSLDRPAQVAPNAEFNHLRALARGAGHVRVVVGLRVAFTPEGALSPAGQEAQHRAIASAGAAIRAALNGTEHRVARTFELVPLIVLELSEEALTRLQDSGLAATLWKDTPRPPPTSSQGATVEAQTVGRGAVVALLDTGVDRAHLRSARVIGEACFSANGNCPNGTTQQVGPGAGMSCDYAPNGCQHGTHTAEIAAGRAGKDIIAIQVFSRFSGEQCKYAADDPCALSFESDHIAGLEHVFQLRKTLPIGTASLSLGSGLFGLGCDGNPLKLAIDNLRSVGIPTLIASGNGGLRDAADAPGCISAAMTVDAADESEFAPADRTRSKALPDLIVTAGALRVSSTGSHRSVDFALRGPGLQRRIEWGHTTKNRKAAGQVTKPARRSLTGLKFENNQLSVLMDGLRVLELDPGEDSSGATEFLIGFDTFDYGTYFTRICADASSPDLVNERDESNNCKETAPFYVIPFGLRGTVTGTWRTIEGATVSWEATVEFLSSADDPPGVFRYILSSRETLVKFKLSGTTFIGGKKCTWSGRVTYRPPVSDDGMTLKFPTDSYAAEIRLPQGFNLPGVLTCPDIGSIPSPIGMSESPWLDTGTAQQFLDPGLTPLQGQFEDGLVTFTWDLEGFDAGP